jgi:hypothetical protein
MSLMCKDEKDANVCQGIIHWLFAGSCADFRMQRAG